MQFMLFAKYLLNALFVLGAVVFFLAVHPAAADTKIILSHSIDIPDRTVIYENNSYEIQTMGSYKMDEPVNMTITATDIRSYTIALIDTKTNFLWYKIVYTEGKDELKLPVGVVPSPGTYILAVFYQGEILDFEQVLFSNITLNINLNTTMVAPGGTLHASITSIPDRDLPLKVVFTQGSSNLEFPVNRTSNGHYEVDIKIPLSASGNFSLYAAMSSGKTILGYPEFASAVNGGFLEVTDAKESSHGAKPSPMIGNLLFAALFFLAFKMLRR